MDQWVSRSLEGPRIVMSLLGLFGAVALVLSSIGIYGVLAFGVGQRVREFGIRQALGADRRSILTLVFKQGLLTTAIGLALGLAGALIGAGVLETRLFGVQARDAAVFSGVTILLLFVSMAACYVPARRATRVEPVVALRDN
jgi:putative ABC transport system permease protein